MAMEAYLYVYEQILTFLGLLNIVAIVAVLVVTVGLYILGTILEVVERVRNHASPTNR